MSNDANPAGSSPADASAPVPVVTAADHAVASGDVASFKEARRAERSGKPLETPPADSSSAEPVDQAASTDASTPPASEPGTNRRRNSDTRVPELLADRARERERADRLERELAQLRQPAQPSTDAKPAGSSPAAAQPAAFPSYDAFLATKPDASYEEYLDARADFRADQKYRALKAEETHAAERAQLSRTQQERATKFQERITAVTATDPEFISRISPDVLALKPFDALLPGERPSALNAIAEELLSSPLAPQLMRHFTDHPEVLQHLGTLSPRDLLREMGKLEASFPDAHAAAPLTPVTGAPAPPTVLGTKPAAPANPIDAAVASGDMTAFKAERMRQRIAAQR